LADYSTAEGLKVDGGFVLAFVGHWFNRGAKIWVELSELFHSGPGHTHDDHKEVAFGRLHDAVNHTYGSNFEKVRWTRRIDFLIPLRQDNEQAIPLLHFVDQFHGRFPSHCQWDDRVREDHRITDG